jgi:(2Fe-2S) ferredoxin
MSGCLTACKDGPHVPTYFASQPPGRSDVDLLTRLVEQVALENERRILLWERTETFAVLAVVACFGQGAVLLLTYVGKIGCLIAVAGAVLIIRKLWGTRRFAKRSAESLPLTEFFWDERGHPLRQIRLLRNVA